MERQRRCLVRPAPDRRRRLRTRKLPSLRPKPLKCLPPTPPIPLPAFRFHTLGRPRNQSNSTVLPRRTAEPRYLVHMSRHRFHVAIRSLRRRSRYPPLRDESDEVRAHLPIYGRAPMARQPPLRHPVLHERGRRRRRR